MGCDGRLYLWQKLSEPPPERKGWREVKEISAAQKNPKRVQYLMSLVAIVRVSLCFTWYRLIKRDSIG